MAIFLGHLESGPDPGCSKMPCGTGLIYIRSFFHEVFYNRQVALPESAKIITPADAFLSENPKTEMKEILITANCQAADKKVVDLKFPKNAMIDMIKRSGKFLVPNGSAVIEAIDSLIVPSDTKEGFDKIDELLHKSPMARGEMNTGYLRVPLCLIIIILYPMPG
jgi:NhaP-type Na+/H+ and K+/H+ antiporter